MNYTNPYEHLSGKISDTKVIKAGFKEKLYNKGDVKINYVVGPSN